MALDPVPSMSPLVVIAHDDPGTADSLRHAVRDAREGEYTLDDVRSRFRQQLGEKKAFDRYVEGLREQFFVDVRF